MTCHRIPNGFICTSNGVYRYKGVTFDWHNYLGPIILRRNTENERNWRNIGNRQWRLVGQWHNLPKAEQKKYRIV